MDNKYIEKTYSMNDLKSVYTQYNPKTGKNEQTVNKIKPTKEDKKNGKNI